MLIYAPEASLSGGRSPSLLVASSCGVSPVALIPQESRSFRSNQLSINSVLVLKSTKKFVQSSKNEENIVHNLEVVTEQLEEKVGELTE
jgi:hypothetical protein